MPSTGPAYLQIVNAICQSLAFITASVHLSLIQFGILKVSSVIINAPNGIHKNLCNIWTARIFRRIISLVVRTPLHSHVTSLVRFDPESIKPGSVVVSCHTPWARLMTQWCAENNYAMIIGWGPWVKRASIAKHAAGFQELRTLTKYLRSGGRVVIMADIFNKLSNCPVKFFEKPCNASLFPLRLAKLANTSIVTVMPSLEDNLIKIHRGPEASLNNEAGKTMQTLLSYFEHEIRQDPSVWSGYIRGSLAKEIYIAPTA